MATPLFSPDQFTPTPFDTAADKAKFANHFVKFVEQDFPQRLFPKWFYTRLSLTFGHIAHYNINGFWSEFFTSLANKVRFLEQTVGYESSISPEYTYCDVERVLRDWVLENQWIEKYAARRDTEAQAARRATYEKLKQEFEPSTRREG